ncbi:MAG: hypothetical protein ACREF1_14260, partial [Acetobacteraceae bacterium]
MTDAVPGSLNAPRAAEGAARRERIVAEDRTAGGRESPQAASPGRALGRAVAQLFAPRADAILR